MSPPPGPAAPRAPILFAVGGVGLGNSTRCHAVIEALGDRPVAILGFGNSARYFRRRGLAVHPLLPLTLARTLPGYLALLPLNLAAWLVNCAVSLVVILRVRPSVVVVDSEYSAILPALLSGRRLVSINNARTIAAWWPRYRRRDLWASAWLRERPDAWVSALADLVVVPSFDPDLALDGRARVVAPIVRRLPPPSVPGRGVLLLRGGSHHLAPIALPPGLAVDEVGGARAVDDALERIAAAETVVCQGGASSLSEALALGRTTIVVPLPGHAEQSSNARWLADRGAVLLAEDGDLAPALDRAPTFRPRLDGLRFDGAVEAARVIGALADEEERSGATSRLASWLTRAWLALFAAGVALDAYVLALGLVKMELANTLDLEYHALVRDGVVVLASPIGAHNDALHHWLFHLLLLVTPRLERVALLLDLFSYLAVLALYVGVRRRLGTVAAAVAGALVVACPVYVILSKHVIATALVPLAGVVYTLAHLDLARGGGRPALGRCVVALAVLVALHHGHAYLGLALVFEAFRARTFRVPAWAIAGALAASATGIVGLLWSVRTLGVAHLAAAFRPEWPYAGVLPLLRRALFVEDHMDEMLPLLDALFVFAAWAVWIALRRRSRFPAGLASLLAFLVPMAWVDREASVVWQVPFVVLVGWAAAERRRLAVAVTACALVTVASYGWLFHHAVTSPPGFFVTSSVRTRYRTLGVLVGELGMRRAEFERLTVRHAQKDADTPAPLPGLSYFVDRVLPPLAPGGDRCFALSDVEPALPPGAVPAGAVDRDGLRYRAWRGGAPCPGNVRLPIPPVLGLDLRSLRVREITFPRGGGGAR